MSEQCELADRLQASLDECEVCAEIEAKGGAIYHPFAVTHNEAALIIAAPRAPAAMDGVEAWAIVGPDGVITQTVSRYERQSWINFCFAGSPYIDADLDSRKATLEERGYRAAKVTITARGEG